jgi:AcrR family transcriptional regulator
MSSRRGLSRDAIATAAIELCDTEGPAALSMRKVAAHLGVGTMSLYHYVKTKDELLELMSDAIMGELLVEDFPSGWREGLRAIALSTKSAFERHGWLLKEMLSGGGSPGPNGMHHFEQSLAALAGLDLDRSDRMHILGVVDEYAFGYFMREATDQDQSDAGQIADAAAYFEEQLASGDFPHTAALLQEGENLEAVILQMFEQMQDAGRFESGLDIVLDGVELYLRRRGAL